MKKSYRVGRDFSPIVSVRERNVEKENVGTLVRDEREREVRF